MNSDQGLIFVVMEHFTRHLYPRAVQIEKELEAGRRLSDAQIDHVARVLEDIQWLRPLIERHPEHRELAAGVIELYASIARRGWENEASPHSGATTGTAGLA